jgi:hypothetical protein
MQQQNKICSSKIRYAAAILRPNLTKVKYIIIIVDYRYFRNG